MCFRKRENELKENNKKVPTWITVLIGIIIAIVVANGISAFIEQQDRQKMERNIRKYQELT